MLKGRIIALSMILVLLFVFGLSTKVAARDDITPINTIINLPGSPLKIISFEAEYKFGGIGRGGEKRISYDVTIQNIYEKKIVAYRLLFVSFNVFNEYLTKLGGYGIESIEPNKTTKSSWERHCYNDDTFLTGVAFVETVKFSDGTIWKADDNIIYEELKKIEKDFDLAILKEKEKEKE